MRAPTAWAISPPTFASISSKTSNGTASCAANADLIASIKREISPLDAIARIGFSGSPGLGENKRSTASKPEARGVSISLIFASNCDDFRNRRSEFSFQRFKERDSFLENGELLGIEIEILGVAAEIARNLRQLNDRRLMSIRHGRHRRVQLFQLAQ